MENPINPPKNYVKFNREDIEQSIPERFEQQVEKFPNHIAIKDNDREITYNSLNNLSNQVAHTILHRLGGKSEAVILLFHQGIELISSILGVLKTNKFYVPVDPINPLSTIETIYKDSFADLIITKTSYLNLLKGFKIRKQNIINLDEILQETFTDNVDLKISPDNYAYIYYTSGSTGPPKGVFDNHRNVLHNIMRYTNSLYISPMDRLTLLQSSDFSGSVSSMFCALLNGAAVYPYNLSKEGISNLANFLNNENITIYHSVPVIFDHLLMVKNKFPSLRIIRLEGDKVSKRHIDLFQKYFGQECFLVNGLGATETGISRQYFISSDIKIKKNIIPVGFETEDMKIRIVNDFNKKVNNGEIGEIVVSSKYLAKGYWRKPELTKSAFHTTSDDGITKDYFTGDLGRLKNDGCLEYLGRKDHLVKVKGHRIEIETIENIINSNASIKANVVNIIEDQNSIAIIVAYIVPKNKLSVKINEIRKTISEKLPAYMAPTKYVTLDSLPTTKNGKIDYSALPKPGKNRPNLEQLFEVARTSIEYDLTKIWGRILEIDKIGIHDNFFDLGGDSLSAFRMLNEVKKQFGQYLPVETILKVSTIDELAQFIDAQIELNDYSSLILFQKKGNKPPIFLIQYHDGILQYKELASLLGEDHPVYGVHIPWEEHSYLGEISLENLADYCVKNITAKQSSGPYLLGGFCFGGLLAMEIAQQLQQREQEIGLLIIIQGPTPEYEKTFLNKPLIHRYIRNFFYRLKLELNNFKIVKKSFKIKYIKKRIKYIKNRIFIKIELYSHHLMLDALKNKRLSSMAHIELISSEYRKASLKYNPHPFKGDLVIFYTPIDIDNVKVEKSLGWQKYINGTITSYEIPEFRQNLLKKPYIEEIADIIKVYLKQIQ